MARSHSICDAQLDVRPYHSLLGKPQPVKADVELVQNITVDVVKMQFIFEHCKADLTEVQNRYGVQIIWIESTNSVTVTPKDEASRDKCSFDEACEAIASLLAEFFKSSTRVPPQAWNYVVENFKKSKSPANEKLRIDYISEQDITEELEKMMEEIDKKLRREASKIEKNNVYSIYVLEVLKKSRIC